MMYTIISMKRMKKTEISLLGINCIHINFKFAYIFICYADLTIKRIMLLIQNCCLILWKLQTSQMTGMILVL